MFGTRYARLTVVALLAALALLAFASAASAASAVQWTHAVYVAGDNDLEKYWDQYSLAGLLDVPASPEVNLVAMVDRLSTDGTELIEIDGGVQSVVATYPEKDFGDGDTLAWFIETVRERYPSTYLCVTLWDHGFGWRYVAKDQTSGGDHITMDEMGQALTDAGARIDILAFDACNMGDVAVAYEAARTGKVGIMVASEESVPFDGFPYDEMLTPVAEDPSRTPVQVATDMVAGWAAYYDALTSANGVHLAAVDIARIGLAASDMRAWSARLAARLPAYAKAYSKALGRSWSPWATRYEDFGDVCRQLIADASITDATLRALTRTVLADLEAALIAQDTAPKTARATGLTLWWASKNTWTAAQEDFRTQVSFAQPAPVGMDWWAFLRAYNKT